MNLKLFKIIHTFCQSSHLTARKYLRSLSETALHYKPQAIRKLTPQENINDRIVQTFFDSSNIQIQICQAEQRLRDVSNFSTPSHSYYSLRLPFKKNQFLRRKMVQFHNSNIRTGRILQLMDYIAANVAYRYCSPVQQSQKDMNDLKFYAVTACIDQIDFYHPVDANHDCQFSGYVSYVGKSSMQIQIDVMQQIQGVSRLNCAAKFVMVARDSNTSKAYLIPRLQIAKEKDIFKIIYQLGDKRQLNRKQQAQKSLVISPPTYEQSSKVHELMLMFKKSSLIEKWISIDSTKQNTTLLMHMQDKNLHGKIFGGYVLKLAYQLSWVCVYKFLKGGYPHVTNIDDVQFLGPVQIGSTLDYQAKICFIKQNLIHVVVICKNTTAKGEKRLTNILRITFMHQQSPQSVGKVYPQSIDDMNQYIQSMRRVNKILKL